MNTGRSPLAIRYEVQSTFLLETVFVQSETFLILFYVLVGVLERSQMHSTLKFHFTLHPKSLSCITCFIERGNPMRLLV